MKSLGVVRRKKKAIIASTIVIAVAVVTLAAGGTVAAVIWLQQHQTATPTKKVASTNTTTEIKKPTATAVSSNILVLGNSFWGRYTNDWSMKSPLKYKYPFSRLNEFDRDKYDAWITGLECPTKPGVNMTSAEMEVALQFNCSPEYLPEAAKWFTAFTLANNHTDNQGADGFADTQKQLDKNGIQYFGHYDPRALNNICDVISLPVTVGLSDGTNKKSKLPVAMCGYHGVFQIPPAESLAVMKKYSPYMPVFAFPHMGLEYKPAPDPLKVTTYHAMIDNGADVVFGDHPHWIQNTESYKGKLIAYSMGNFMFDQQGSTEVTRSAGFNLILQADTKDSALLDKWLALGEKCATYHDSCLADAQEQGLKKILFTHEYKIIGSNDDNKIVKPATAAEQASILQRLNWNATEKQLTKTAF